MHAQTRHSPLVLFQGLIDADNVAVIVRKDWQNSIHFKKLYRPLHSPPQTSYRTTGSACRKARACIVH